MNHNTGNCFAASAHLLIFICWNAYFWFSRNGTICCWSKEEQGDIKYLNVILYRPHQVRFYLMLPLCWARRRPTIWPPAEYTDRTPEPEHNTEINISWTYFRVKLSCVCLKITYKKKSKDKNTIVIYDKMIYYCKLQNVNIQST